MKFILQASKWHLLTKQAPQKYAKSRSKVKVILDVIFENLAVDTCFYCREVKRFFNKYYLSVMRFLRKQSCRKR